MGHASLDNPTPFAFEVLYVGDEEGRSLFDVKIEGKGVARALDLMLHNDKNTPPVPLIQGPVVAMGEGPGEPKCLVCEKKV